MAAASTSTRGGTFTLTEAKGDLFTCSGRGASLAHCISQDLHMGKGIAAIFKKKFGGVGQLKAQNVRVGGCAILKRDERYIFYLVTKPKYFHKPSYLTLKASLGSLRKHIEEFGIKELCMPRIGCGLDHLEWDRVKEIICEVCQDLELSVTVYYL